MPPRSVIPCRRAAGAPSRAPDAGRPAPTASPIQADDLLNEADRLLPSVWVADPGPKVLAVDDRSGRRWHRGQMTTHRPIWCHTDPETGAQQRLRWGELLQDHAPLTDATNAETARG